MLSRAPFSQPDIFYTASQDPFHRAEATAQDRGSPLCRRSWEEEGLKDEFRDSRSDRLLGGGEGTILPPLSSEAPSMS